MKRIHFISLIVLFVLLFFCSNGNSFDIDGFRNGMSQETIKNNLSEWKFDKVEEKENFIKAWDIPKRGNERLYVFNFCNKKLRDIQKNFEPSMKNFIFLFNKFSSIHGKPIDSHTDSSLSNIGESWSIAFYWRTGRDLVTLTYYVHPNNDQLTVMYENDSKCSK